MRHGAVVDNFLTSIISKKDNYHLRLLALKAERQLFQYEGKGYNKEDHETVAQAINSILFEQKLCFQNVLSSSYM